MLVEDNILFDVPDLFHVLKVTPEFLPPSIPFSKGKCRPELFVEQLVDGRVTVDAGT